MLNKEISGRFASFNTLFEALDLARHAEEVLRLENYSNVEIR